MRPAPVVPSRTTEPADERLLDARQVAEMFGRTLRTLSNWERSGVLIPVRHAGLRYYPASEVRALWFNSNNIVEDQSDDSSM
jgi:phage terminase Nu1 subunit (DNA packaging protein)